MVHCEIRQRIHSISVDNGDKGRPNHSSLGSRVVTSWSMLCQDRDISASLR